MTDFELTSDVERALELTARIGVSADRGVVMLSGYVATTAEKDAAEQAATRVPGVVAIANELVVSSPTDALPCDAEIEVGCIAAIRARRFEHAVRVIVHRRWVTLEGTLAWDHQRRTAELAVKQVRGVVGVTNHVVLA